MEPIRVRNVFTPGHSLAMNVHPDTRFDRILRQFAETEWLRSVFVVDEDERLIGVITRADILHWAQAKLGGVLQSPHFEPEDIVRMVQLMRATTAREAIHPRSDEAAVQLDTLLSHALRKMIDLDLVAIPVVDEEGRVIGDLTLSNALQFLLSLSSEM
ncbi:MAG: hypothetical protein Kow0047_34220 [Anaerolineae bacterium]